MVKCHQGMGLYHISDLLIASQLLCSELEWDLFQWCWIGRSIFFGKTLQNWLFSAFALPKGSLVKRPLALRSGTPT